MTLIYHTSILHWLAVPEELEGWVALNSELVGKLLVLGSVDLEQVNNNISKCSERQHALSD